MDVLNKFYSSMTNKVSHISGVLLGNPVTREFEATQFIATAGPGLLWKIYKGFKKSTKQEVAIFILEKKQLEHIDKVNYETILENLKRGITQLTKLRHPNILTVQYSLEESRDSLAFASEPVLGSLANVLGDVGSFSNNMLSTYTLHEVEIKYGLLNIIEGLAFLQNDVKLLHRNICPQSIIINQKGAWKIFGFDMCVANISRVGQPASWPFVEYTPTQHPLVQPMLDYLAPEHVLSARHCFASDIYSLGMLIYVIFNPEHQPLGKVGNNYNKFRAFVSEMRNRVPSGLQCVPEGLQDFLKLMLNPIPELRPDLHQLSLAPYFDDFAIKTLKYIDTLVQLDNVQKSQFFKSLPQLIPKLPHRVCLERVLPCLLNEFSNAPMLPFVLPNVLQIAETCSGPEYVKLILPTLKPIMLIQEPIQVQVVFMNKIDFLIEKTPAEDLKSDVLPMLYRALDLEVQHIQEMSLTLLPTMINYIEYATMKNAVLPRLRKICTTTTDISLKVKALLCLSKLVEHMDKWMVLDEIVPFLVQLQVKQPAVLMAVLGLFAIIMTNNKLGISKEILVEKVLPFLVPLCLENTLTVNQFNTLISLIKQMVSKVETDQRATLEQLNSMRKDVGAAEETLVPEKVVDKPKCDGDKTMTRSSLGLDLFAGRPPSPQPLPLAAPLSIKANCKSETMLSIEDKQRLAQQQEQVRAMSRQASLAPPLGAPLPPPPLLRASPDAAIQNNISQLSTSTNKTLSVQSDTLHNRPMSSVNPFGYPHSERTVAQKTSRPDSIMSVLSPTISEASSWCTNNYNNNVKNLWTSNQSQQTRQDWSAFESLLLLDKDNNEPQKTVSDEIIDLLS